MRDVFKQNSCKTGSLGKWHFKDDYITKPTDLGFETVIHYLIGDVGELSDFWINSCFEDVYCANNAPKQVEWYCTVVCFNKAIKCIDKNIDKLFFVYLATNLPLRYFNNNRKIC